MPAGHPFGAILLGGAAGPVGEPEAAIDAAPPGAIIRVEAGAYPGALTLSKGVTLEGAGGDTTRLTGTDAAQTALRIENAEGVRLRGLRFSSPGEHTDGALMPGGIVMISGSSVRIDDCVLAGGPANGLVIGGQSDVEITRCLVTGVWSEGIVVNSPAKARIARCDVRNVHHYGVLIRPGTEVTVEDCRISGTGWHAIRYDNASPTIRHNLLFENERTGIYANGKTTAEVSGNHFHANGMVGLSCWGNNADQILGNTFSNNLRSAIEILGNSNPRVEHNLFFENPVGVANSNVTPESPFVSHLESVVFKSNMFWENQANLRFYRDKAELDAAGYAALLEPRGNVEADPLFTNAAELDFELQTNSPAREAGIGAADPLGFQSPWPAQPEETPFTRSRERAAVVAAAPSQRTAYQAAQPWIEEVLQIEDADLRAAGVEQIRAALASGDGSTRLAGLIAFLGTHEGNYDKSTFRGLILKCID